MKLYTKHYYLPPTVPQPPETPREEMLENIRKSKCECRIDSSHFPRGSVRRVCGDKDDMAADQGFLLIVPPQKSL